jgi:hypothetical protein
MIIITRSEAKKAGLVKYFTGKPCSAFGHVDERYTRNGECFGCAKLRSNDWNKKNPDQQKQYRKNYFEKNFQKEYASRKAWMNAHPEQALELKHKKNKATVLWAQNNRDKSNAYQAKRRASKIQRTPAWLNAAHYFEMECVYKYCAALRLIGLDYHVDHIIPLQSTQASGFHVPWNLQVITAQENFTKNNRMVNHA